MGNASKKPCVFEEGAEVNFDHFQILRAIGKGSFGKVCIVQKKDTKKMYAMKYMNKLLCIQNDAVKNVLREQEILKNLDHPFIVNLWFTFQDSEDMFMVVDLLLGGDLRYHMQQNAHFDNDTVRLYLTEMSLALHYLHQQHILHRDIKPDNILLDEQGHVHITDFNVATILEDSELATSLSGTRPYMAPEMFQCAQNECLGYSFPVDWWAMGCTIYELIRGKRPYDIHSNSPVEDILQQFDSEPIHLPSHMDMNLKDLLHKLLCLEPAHRYSGIDQIKDHPYMVKVDCDEVLRMEVKPSFVPSKSHLNCDPTYELEELIIESKPLHKKKKRLSKSNSKSSRNSQAEIEINNPMQQLLEKIDKDFQTYNRDLGLKRVKESGVSEEQNSSQ